MLKQGMFSLGVTGGIAGGKSHACKVLSRLGAHVLDADRLAHEAYLPGTTLSQQIGEAFGHEVLTATGQVDRRRLGQLVFGRPDRLQRLQDLVWPAVTERVDSEMQSLHAQGCRWVVLEAALLLQASWTSMVEEVWCFYTSPEEAKARVMRRNGLTESEASDRLRSQPPVSFYLERCSVAIDTSGPKAHTAALIEQEVTKLRRRLKESHGFTLPGAQTPHTKQ